MNQAKIGFGCGNFGGIGSNSSLYGQGDSEINSYKLLDIAKEKGIRLFDTANSYGGGNSEIWLGKWLKNQSSHFRSNVEISTKVGNPFGRINSEQNVFSRAEIFGNIDRSLERLNIECIDTFYLHEMPEPCFYDQVLEALSIGLSKGKINNIGLSNVTLDHVLDFHKAAGSSLAKKINTVQNEFNLLSNKDSAILIPELINMGVRYIAHSPLAGGLLAKNYSDVGNSYPENSRLLKMKGHYSKLTSEENLEKISRLSNESKLLKKSISACALNFIINSQGVYSVLISPRSLGQFDDLQLPVP